MNGEEGPPSPPTLAGVTAGHRPGPSRAIYIYNSPPAPDHAGANQRPPSLSDSVCSNQEARSFQALAPVNHRSAGAFSFFFFSRGVGLGALLSYLSLPYPGMGKMRTCHSSGREQCSKLREFSRRVEIAIPARRGPIASLLGRQTSHFGRLHGQPLPHNPRFLVGS